MRILPLERLHLDVNKKIEISGIVQGVGFRPFVYKLAHRYALSGSVRNSNDGVELQVQGKMPQVQAFIDSLQQELPSLAHIDSLDIEDDRLMEYKGFRIVESDDTQQKRASMSPDISVCESCLEEMREPSNRRFGYPFINCTDCGPRYSIMQRLPYDRPNISMKLFQMCKECEAEYNNPEARRFHAQPISCFNCGPTLSLLDSKGRALYAGKEAIQKAIEAVREGKIIALKGLGGFHLICDATNRTSVSLLRERKKRPSKPFAVMFPDIDMLKASVIMSSKEEALVLSKEKPIVIASRSDNHGVFEAVAPGIDRLGVFLPYTPLHHLLLEGVGRSVVATSANVSDEPIITGSHDLIDKLGRVVDLVLDHDREIVNANDDTVMQVVAGENCFLRMARGFAPRNIPLPFKSEKKILALGAHQKDTISLVIDDKLIMSPHIGDLNSVQAFEYFERTVETFERMYDFHPDVIVCDEHPEYMTSRWAKERQVQEPSTRLIKIQHHYAHLLAVKAEHNLMGKALGFAFDGTGFGNDKVNSKAREGSLGCGSIWGAEVMILDEKGYQRHLSLHPFRLLGGEKAVKEPRRSALSLLFEYFSLEEVLNLESPIRNAFTAEELKLLHRAWEKGVNSPYATSMGRLFDAVASLADIVHFSSYEGESGLKMEACVDRSNTRHFPFSITEGRIDLEAMVRAIISMKQKREIVSMFFNTLVEIIVQVSRQHPDLPLIFSGGVFQNKVLAEKIVQRMQEEERSFYFQNTTPLNDGGISLGQAWYAVHNL